MIEIRPNMKWSAEAYWMLKRAVELDPLADILDEADAVLNGRKTLFGVWEGETLLGCFTGCRSTSEKGDEFLIGAAAARDEKRPVSAAVIANLERLGAETQACAVRMQIYNPRLMPVLRRKGYAPISVTMRKEI